MIQEVLAREIRIVYIMLDSINGLVYLRLVRTSRLVLMRLVSTTQNKSKLTKIKYAVSLLLLTLPSDDILYFILIHNTSTLIIVKYQL